MSTGSHTEVRELSNDERIFNLYKNIWIGYPGAVAIRDRMEGLLKLPTTHRMPNLALIGESNSGKSMLLNNFFKRHSPDLDPNAEKTILPVLIVQMPAEPNESRLYGAILHQLFADPTNRELPASMINRIKVLFRSLEIKMLILDEFNNALAGSYIKQRRFLNGIRYLSNELMIPIVVAGTVEAQRALSSDPQLANRFEPVYLHRWKLDENLIRLLMTFEPTLGLKQKSNLYEPTNAENILIAGEGLIGDMLMMLRRLAEKAIKDGTERIEPKWLTKAFLDDFGWVIPSMRMKHAG